MDYVKIEVSIKQVDFDYINLFKRRKHESYSGMGLFYAFLGSTYTLVVEMNTANIEDGTNVLMEQLRDKAIDTLQARFKGFELKNIDFDVTLKQASEESVEWCIKNLTVPQLVNMGISIINDD